MATTVTNRLSAIVAEIEQLKNEIQDRRRVLNLMLKQEILQKQRKH